MSLRATLLEWALAVFILIPVWSALWHWIPGRFNETVHVRSKAEEAISLEHFHLSSSFGQLCLDSFRALFSLHFGPSPLYPGQNLNALVLRAWKVSAFLTVLSFGVALLFGLPLGFCAALLTVKTAQMLAQSALSLSLCLSPLVAGMFLLVLEAQFPAFEHLLHTLSFKNGCTSVVNVQAILCLGMSQIGVVAQLTQQGFEHWNRQPFVAVLQLRGFSRRRILLEHCLRPALVPLITFLGPTIGGILGASVVVERIFFLPGLGTLVVNATLNRDPHLLLACTLITMVSVGGTILVSRLLVPLCDPRLRYEGTYA